MAYQPQFRRTTLGPVTERLPPGHGLVPVVPKLKRTFFVTDERQSILGEDLSGETDAISLDEIGIYYYRCTNDKSTHYFTKDLYLSWCERTLRCLKCPYDNSRMDLDLYRQDITG